VRRICPSIASLYDGVISTAVGEAIGGGAMVAPIGLASRGAIKQVAFDALADQIAVPTKFLDAHAFAGEHVS